MVGGSGVTTARVSIVAATRPADSRGPGPPTTQFLSEPEVRKNPLNAFAHFTISLIHISYTVCLRLNDEQKRESHATALFLETPAN